ncbi:hypothetical protein AWC38_SpisGene10897 [Stylophora pistillata]|uniref:SEA domain-containing protein n=1 Tax=Stylophora pistillata TaxID=50429 RepID=A0A2B4S608_STYPI|nr:hypothetical protein AWC38_SpisGene10897 [Stylophora pistillata]
MSRGIAKRPGTNEDHETLANKFNKYFTSVGELTAKKANLITREHGLDEDKDFGLREEGIGTGLHAEPEEFEFQEVKEIDVKSVIKSLATSKAPGFDKISARVLKDSCESIAPVISRLANNSFNVAAFPKVWKIAEYCFPSSLNTEIPFATPPPTESSSTEKPPTGDTSRPTSAESISTEKPPSESTSRPTTADVAVERKTDFSIEIRVSEEWDDRLTDTSSEKFKELANRMKQEIRKAYSGDFKLKEVVIISMRKGSIIAEFQLKFDKEVTAEEVLAPLKKETADGKLGSLKVDPASLKETDRKKDFTIEIRVSEEWDDRLTDTSSEKFKELAIRMKQEIRKAYSGDFKLKEVVIISMRKGSIIAEFQLKFDKEVTAEEVLAPLKKETADGKLGSLKVDPASLKETDRKKADDDDGEEKPSIGRLVIIGASIGGLVVVAVLMIGFYVYCKRTGTPSNGGRFEDGMPDDDPCEKYELKPADDEKEHITSMEEKGIHNEGME